MNAIASQPFVRTRQQDSPPHWAEVAVKVCVAGILLLPVGMPLLMVASSVLGPQGDILRPIAFVSSVVLWVLLVLFAQVLTSHYPPVRRAR